MTDDEPATVIIHARVDFREEGDWDTDMSIEAWNALSDQERSDLARLAWEDIAQPPSGGVWVTTTGAKDLS